MQQHGASRSTLVAIAAALVLALAMAACGGGDDEAGDTGEAAATTPATSPSPSPQETETEEAAAEVEVTATDYAFDLPETLPAGETTFTLVNQGDEPHEMAMVKLVEGAPPVEKLLKLPEKKVGKFFAGPPGGIRPVKPGETSDKPFTTELTPGTYAFVCFVTSPDKTPHAFKGMHATVTVE